MSPSVETPTDGEVGRDSPSRVPGGNWWQTAVSRRKWLRTEEGSFALERKPVFQFSKRKEEEEKFRVGNRKPRDFCLNFVFMFLRARNPSKLIHLLNLVGMLMQLGIWRECRQFEATLSAGIKRKSR